MIIRDAKIGDEDGISVLYQDFCKEFGEAPTTPPQINCGKLVVCDLGNSLCGYGSAKCVSYGDRQYTQGEHIYIKPSYRGTKVGTFIYSALRRWARAEQRPIILLSGVDEYEKWYKLGYRTIRHIMVKEIKCTNMK